jgi:hypothetical protein
MPNLWHHEHQTGREQAQKDRPSVIVLAIQREASGATVVTVLPITHSAPVNRASAVEIRCQYSGISGSTTTRPGLWFAEGNEFLWPGYDLRKLPHSDRYDYGFLPPHFFNQVLDAFVDWCKSNRRHITPRE